jgi:hypothetical protein
VLSTAVQGSYPAGELLNEVSHHPVGRIVGTLEAGELHRCENLPSPLVIMKIDQQILYLLHDVCRHARGDHQTVVDERLGLPDNFQLLLQLGTLLASARQGGGQVAAAAVCFR